jgi:hypothetical protein
MNRPPLEVADIIRSAGESFLEQSRHWITSQHRKVLLASCAAARLCSAVIAIAAQNAATSPSRITRAATGIAPSAKATPACGGSLRGSGNCCPQDTCTPSSPCRANWRRWLCRTRKVIFNLLFHASAETLLEVARDPRHLGAEIGFVTVLHTWDQRLQFHPHAHCVLAAGGLSPDRTR